ncbi:MAG: hypothetical protein E7587_00955 [Ruminococcaceae bacterium]|nr:hypothetical protein [Oscillospiraceae bacterium]
MKNKRLLKFIYNGLVLTAAAIIMRTVSVSFNAYVTSRVGAEGIGLFTLTLSIYGFAVTFATSGVNLAATRLIAEAMARDDEKGAKKALRACLLYSAIFGSAASLCLFFGADFIGKTLLSDIRTIPSLRLLSLSLVPISLSSSLNGYFTAVRRVSKNAACQLFEQAVKITVTAYALSLFLPKGITYSCMALVGGGAISEFASFFFLLAEYIADRHIHAKKLSAESGTKTKKGALAKALLGISVPVALSAYVRSALVTVEHILIPKTLSESGASKGSALASYGRLHSMALPIVLYPMAALTAFAGLLIPEFAEKTAANDKNAVSDMAENAIHYTLLFSVGCAGVLAVFGNSLGALIYNSGEAGVYITLLAPVVPIMYLDHVTDAMLKGIGKQVYSMVVNISDSVLSILLVLLILPKMGAVGYVLVIIIAEVFNFSLSITGLTGAVSFRFAPLRSLFPPLASAFISGSLCKTLPFGENAIGLCVKILLCVALYLVFVIVCEKFICQRNSKERKISA